MDGRDQREVETITLSCIHCGQGLVTKVIKVVMRRKVLGVGERQETVNKIILVHRRVVRSINREDTCTNPEAHPNEVKQRTELNGNKK